MRQLLQKSTDSQSCKQDCPDFAEKMKREVLRVRSDGSIPPYVTEAESRKQHSDSPLCNSLMRSLYIMCQLCPLISIYISTGRIVRFPPFSNIHVGI